MLRSSAHCLGCWKRKERKRRCLVTRALQAWAWFMIKTHSFAAARRESKYVEQKTTKPNLVSIACSVIILSHLFKEIIRSIACFTAHTPRQVRTQVLYYVTPYRVPLGIKYKVGGCRDDPLGCERAIPRCLPLQGSFLGVACKWLAQCCYGYIPAHLHSTPASWNIPRFQLAFWALGVWSTRWYRSRSGSYCSLFFFTLL